MPVRLSILLACFALCFPHHARAGDDVHYPDYSGATWRPGPSDLSLEDFSTEEARLGAYGQATYSAVREPVADAPCGGRGLVLRMPATGQRGAHGIDVVIPMTAGRKDWSGYDGLEFWVRVPAGSSFDLGSPQEGVRGRIDLTVWTEGAGADERMRRVDVMPGAGGKWQRVIAPFDTRKTVSFPYSAGWWRSSRGAGRDSFAPQGRRDVGKLRMRVPANMNAPVEIMLAGVGLYREPAADGPTLSLDTGSAGGLVFATGEPFVIRLKADKVPVKTAGLVRFEATDFNGRTVYREEIPIDGSRGTSLDRELRWDNRTPGWFDAKAVLELDGKVVFRVSRGLASLPPLTPEQDAARRASIFGIWPEVHPALGVGVVRKPFKAWEDKADWRPSRLPSDDVVGVAWVIGAPWEDGKWFAVNSEGYEAWGERLTKAVRQVAPSGRWPYWGAINEPNVHYWGPMEKVVEYHRAVYEAVKKGDPAAKVGGPCPHDISVDYLEKFVAAGGARWIDFFDVHGYSSSDRQFEEKLDALHAFLRKHGLEDKEIILTETGYTVPAVTPRQQAELLVKTYAVALSRRVKVLVWHALFSGGSRNIAAPGPRPIDNRHADFNIIRNDGSANPAFVAYGAMTRMLLGASYVSPVEKLPEGCAGFVFRKGDRRIRVMWNREAEIREAVLPVRGAVELVDLMGVAASPVVTDGGTVRLPLSATPVYLVDSE